MELLTGFVPISEGFGAPVSAACFSLPRKCSSGLEHSSAPSLATNLPPASLLNASTLLSDSSILSFVPIDEVRRPFASRLVRLLNHYRKKVSLCQMF